MTLRAGAPLTAADEAAALAAIDHLGVARGGRLAVAGRGVARFGRILMSTWTGRIGAVLALAALFLAAFGPMLARYPLNAATGDVSQAPSLAHWFGTDANGFDVFSRVIAAPRIDVTIGLAGAVISFVAGSAVGLVAGFFAGWGSGALMRGIDTLQSFPVLILSLIIVVFTGRNIWSIIFVAGLFNAPIYLRLMRGEVLSLRTRPFVEAARGAGNSEASVAVRHVLPNALSPALAQFPITIGFTILITTGLSFLGGGVRPPAPEWGDMIASGADGILIGQWWTPVFAGAAMALAVFGFAAVGEAVRGAVYRV